MEKSCLECGEKIMGRTDKKFCSDYCRNAWHNKNNQDNSHLIRKINNQLRKNYKILQQFNPTSKTNLHKKKLLAEGFSFDYFTSIYTTKNGTVYYFVYNQGYLKLENDYLALVKKD